MGIPTLLAGRSLIESHVRDRVRGIDNVSFHEGHEVTSLVLNASKGRIAGVCTSPTGDPSQQALLEADLVIDATGRGARGVTWLRDAGLALPEEDETTIHIVYTTRHFRCRDRTIQVPFSYPVAALESEILDASTHSAYTLRSTSTLCPARSATSGAGTPALSQSETAACCAPGLE